MAPLILIELVSAAGAAAVGVLALAGWILDLPSLASFDIDRIPMAPSSALFFLAIGLALALRGFAGAAVPPPDGAGLKRNAAGLTGDGAAPASMLLAGARCLVFGTMLGAALLFSSALLGYRPGIETLGLSLSRVYPGLQVGHMSPATALLFCLSSIALLLEAPTAGPVRERGAQYLGGLVLMLSFVFLLAYLLGDPLFYDGALIPPALSTIVGLLLIGLAVLVRASRRLPAFAQRTGGREASGATILPILLLFLSAIVSTGLLYYGVQQQEYRKAVVAQLQSVADLKAAQLKQFRLSRLADAALISGSREIGALAARWLEAPSDLRARAALLDGFAALLEHGRYSKVRLHDARGAISLAFPEAGAASKYFVLPSQAIAGRESVLLDFSISPEDGKPYLGLLIPVIGAGPGGERIGSLVLHIDPEVFLYPFIETWPGHSRSAETLLLRRDGDMVVLLNRLRFSSAPPLSLRIAVSETQVPSVQAVLGRSGIVEGQDYRGAAAIAAIAPVPDSPWFVLARMDREEVFEPLRESMWIMLTVVLVLAAGASLLVFAFFRGQLLGERRERLGSERKLNEASAMLDSLFEHANASILVWDMDLRIVRANRAFEALSGRSSAELLGQGLDTLFPPELAQAYLDRIRAMRSGTRWEVEELKILSKGGELKTLLWNTAQLFADEQGGAWTTIAQGQDITAVREAESHQRRQIGELKRWQAVMLEREARIAELKAEVNDALLAAGTAPRYAARSDGARVAGYGGADA